MKIDSAVYNAARLDRLYGTLNCRGTSIPARPHRRACLFDGPAVIEVASLDVLTSLAALAVDPPSTNSPTRNSGVKSFNLEGWIADHHLGVIGPHEWGGKGLKWIFEVCPFNPDHTNRSAVLLKFEGGAVAFRCLHDGCRGYDWTALRAKLDSDGRSTSSGDFPVSDPLATMTPVHVQVGEEERPHPLVREIPPATPYPVERLGKLTPVVRQLRATIKAPLALCGQSVLAAVGLAVQAYADILIDGRGIPLSENFITVGESGERKSAVDKEVLRPHRDYEKRLAEKYGPTYQSYENDMAAYKKAREEALKKAKTRDEKRAALEKIGTLPEAPLLPILTTEEPTYEGLIKLLQHGQPSMGLFADEGGRFLGGYGMSEEHALKTAAGLSELWDGKRITRVRGGDGAALLYGRRLSLHLMVQPGVAQKVLSNQELIDQGLVSRCLVTWPESTAGTREYSGIDLSADRVLLDYGARIKQILETPFPLAEGKQNELAPRSIRLSPEARQLWIAFHNTVEKNLAAEQPFSTIKGFANKAPEHALRLAGILVLYDDLHVQEISVTTLGAGIDLAQHYLAEALRLFHSGLIDADLILAGKLLTWAQSRGQYVSLMDIYQRGPNAVRDAATALKLATLLVEHGWFKAVPGGREIDGIFRRQVWEVVK